MQHSPDFLSILQQNPIVAAIKNPQELAACLESECQIVFVLYGDILHIDEITGQIQKAGKRAVVHVDLIEGLAPKDVAIDFIAQKTCADGIISTKPNLIKYAKSRDLFTVHRFFILDSIALANVAKNLPTNSADAIEIIPGVMPKVIRKVVQSTAKPVIAGGLIADKEDVMHALQAGATAVSSTNRAVWSL